MSFPPGTEMFQFPGFALETLCVQVPSPCLSRLWIAPKSNHNQLSGGFPHSEIHGSKPIPGSPWLIAGYHVLHRLLLPRHPPNALLALDPTQRQTDTGCRQPKKTSPSVPAPRTALQLARPWAESHTSLASAAIPTGTARKCAVSVLDLDTDPPRARSPGRTPTRARQRSLMLSLFTLFNPLVRLDGPAPEDARQSSRQLKTPQTT